MKPDGTAASKGYAQVRVRNFPMPLFDGPWKGKSLDLENWTGEPLIVTARVEGFEEERFFDVDPRLNETIKLTPSQLVTLNLTGPDGKPVSQARVRKFAWTKEASRNYPYPSQGLEGDIVAQADKNGVVQIKTLPAKREGADLIHIVLVEPLNGLAPKFVGPFKTNQTIDVQLEDLITVSGVVRGTERQLKDFAADWDQPVKLVLGNGETSSLYADSVRLETKREGDQLKFTLKNLMPGKLRIIANFEPRPHHIKRVFKRREPMGLDKLFEFDLTESRNDLILDAD